MQWLYPRLYITITAGQSQLYSYYWRGNVCNKAMQRHELDTNHVGSRASLHAKALRDEGGPREEIIYVFKWIVSGKIYNFW